jgi:diguanylate cyclase (GGDEF)-like protein
MLGLSLCLMACPASALTGGGQIDLEQYGAESGLSQLSVTSLVQDDLGFLWVGTQDGLNRFDGHRFEVRRFEPESAAATAEPLSPGPFELASGSIDALGFDARHWLWLGTNDAGLQRINLRGERSEWLSPDLLQQPQVYLLATRQDGSAWLGMRDSVVLVGSGFDLRQRFDASGEPVALVASDDGSALLLTAECRLLRLQPGTPAVTLWQRRVPGSPCRGLIEDHGAWVIADSEGVARVTPAAGAESRRTLPTAAGGEIERLLMRRSGELLAGLSNGELWSFGEDAGAEPTPLALSPQPTSAITALFEDRDAVLWIGSYTEGLFRERAPVQALNRALAPTLPVAGLSNTSVRAIHRTPKELLVGLDRGLLRQPQGAAVRRVPAFDSERVRAIAVEPEGGYWIGTDSGLWRLADDDSAERVAETQQHRITAVLREPGRLLVSTRSGLLDLRLPELELQPVPDELAQLFLTSLARDSLGRLWIGSNERGVWLLEAGRPPRALGLAEGLSHPSVWSLLADERGMWVGSFSGGLHLFDLDGQRQRLLSTRNGLSSNVVYQILADAKGQLWLSTNDGINVVDPASGAVRVLRRADGLRNSEFNSGASFRDSEGRLWFGGTEGLDLIEPWRQASSSEIALPVINTLSLPGREGARRGLAATGGVAVAYAERIELGYRDSVFGLGLSAIDTSAPAAARLRHRLSGLEQNWTQHPRGRVDINYAYLPPGSYALEVQAAGRDGRFGDSRLLQIEVAPPPWRHPLAWLGYAALVLLLALAVAVRLRTRTRSEHALVERLNLTVEARTAELERANQLLLASNDRLEQANRTDPLTGVANRRELQAWLQTLAPELQMALAAQPELAPADPRSGLVFFMIDIDNFKQINDSQGHQCGDGVLVEFSRRLRHLCREQDRLVRWGGEEFLLVIHDPPEDASAALAERIRSAIAGSPLEMEGYGSLALSCSIGYAPWPLSRAWPSLGDWEQSVNLADQALYRAKHAGKNTWVGLRTGPGIGRARLLQLLAATSVSGWPDHEICIETAPTPPAADAAPLTP